MANWSVTYSLKSAFNLTKSNPKLWILGLAVSVLVVSGGNGNGSRSSSDNSSTSINAPDTIKTVTADAQNIITTYAPDFRQISLPYYLIWLKRCSRMMSWLVTSKFSFPAFKP